MHIFVSLIVLSVLALSSANSPVLLLGGLGGAVLQTSLHGFHPQHWWCKHDSPLFTSWLQADIFLPKEVDCWIHYMSPVLGSDGLLHDRAGARTIPYDFGGVNGVSSLDPSLKIFMPYFSTIIQELEGFGYVAGHDLRSAPYDWRFSPVDLADRGYFHKAKELIEEMFHSNNDSRISIISHSMGGPMCLHLLHTVTQAWKDKYIERIITIGAPWAGSVDALKTLTCGDNLGAFVLPHNYIRPFMNSLSSIAWLTPTERPSGKGAPLWSAAELAKTPSKNYSLSNFEEMLQDLGLSQSEKLYRRALKETTLVQLEAPKVDIFIIYGEKLATPLCYTFAEDFEANSIPTSPAHTEMGDGDGTVNYRSLVQRPLEEWTPVHQQTGHILEFHSIAHADHMGILHHSQLLAKIRQIFGLEFPSTASEVVAFE